MFVYFDKLIILKVKLIYFYVPYIALGNQPPRTGAAKAASASLKNAIGHGMEWACQIFISMSELNLE